MTDEDLFTIKIGLTSARELTIKDATAKQLTGLREKVGEQVWGVMEFSGQLIVLNKITHIEWGKQNVDGWADFELP